MEERGKTFKLSGLVRKSKTNAENVGQTFTIMENDGKTITWNGIPAISEGTL